MARGSLAAARGAGARLGKSPTSEVDVRLDLEISERQALRQTYPAIMNAPAGSTGRVTLTGCRGLLDRVQHPMARDRIVERGAEMRSLAIVAGETRVRLGDVGDRAAQRREPVLLRHGQDLERGLRAVAATYGHIEDLGLAAVSRNLQVALGAVDLPEQIRAARTPAAIVNRERGAALKQSGDAHLIVRVHRPALSRLRDRE